MEIEFEKIRISGIIAQVEDNNNKTTGGYYLACLSLILNLLQSIRWKIICEDITRYIPEEQTKDTVLWNLVIKRSDITTPFYNKEISCWSQFFIFPCIFHPNITRNLI